MNLSVRSYQIQSLTFYFQILVDAMVPCTCTEVLLVISLHDRGVECTIFQFISLIIIRARCIDRIDTAQIDLTTKWVIQGRSVAEMPLIRWKQLATSKNIWKSQIQPRERRPKTSRSKGPEVNQTLFILIQWSIHTTSLERRSLSSSLDCYSVSSSEVLFS